MKHRHASAANLPGLNAVALHRAVLAAGLLGLMGLSACVQALPPASSPEVPPDVQWQAIETLDLGDLTCAADSQCRTLAVGSKACGGPERWLAWSSKGTDEAALRQQINRVASATASPPGRRGGQSDCSVLPDPGAACRAGRCVLLQGSAAVR